MSIRLSRGPAFFRVPQSDYTLARCFIRQQLAKFLHRSIDPGGVDRREGRRQAREHTIAAVIAGQQVVDKNDEVIIEHIRKAIEVARLHHLDEASQL
jgi:hypothetical protein